MPLWLLITLLAHLANAVVFVVDKVLLGSRVRPRPSVYAFYSAVLGLFAFVLVPFGGIDLPDGLGLLLGLLAGVAWVFALVLFFHALNEGEASRIAPVVGGFVPLFTIFFSFFFLRHAFSSVELIAFALLVGGGVVITARRSEKGVTLHLFEVALAAGALFALSFVVSDMLFDRYSFVSGLIWTRVAGFVAALFFLVIPSVRGSIVRTRKRASQEHTLVFLGNKGLAGLALIGITYAIAIGPVSLVNALQGAQYAFLFFIAAFLSWKFPKLLQEERRGLVLIQKISGIVIIAAGLVLLA